MVTRWLTARHAGESQPMIDRRNRRRGILNAVAHRVVQADGMVAVAGCHAYGREFCIGDEVLTRSPARHLYPLGAPATHPRNGHGAGSSSSTTAAMKDGERRVESLACVAIPGWFIEAHPGRRGHVTPGASTQGTPLTSHAVQRANAAGVIERGDRPRPSCT
jgi:hypothetical protein